MAKTKESKPETKFAGFIASKKLDPRRILIARAAGDAPATEPKETRKPRSGRPVSGRALTAAMEGGTLSGPTKTRLVRAVNHLLEQKKQEQVGLRELF
jgi:hypothetical protein